MVAVYSYFPELKIFILLSRYLIFCFVDYQEKLIDQSGITVNNGLESD